MPHIRFWSQLSSGQQETVRKLLADVVDLQEKKKVLMGAFLNKLDGATNDVAEILDDIRDSYEDGAPPTLNDAQDFYVANIVDEDDFGDED